MCVCVTHIGEGHTAETYQGLGLKGRKYESNVSQHSFQFIIHHKLLKSSP